MLDELSGLMHQQLPQALPLKLQKGKERYDEAAQGSIRIARLVQWGLVRGQRKNPVGWLYASAAIGSRAGAGLLVGKTSSLTVGYGFGENGWGNILRAGDLTTGNGEGGPWEGVDVAAGGRLILLCGCPWKYTEEDSQWHFCLPLFVLNTVRDLTDYVVTPVIRLLQGEAPDVALGRHLHAFRFRAVDERLELAEAP